MISEFQTALIGIAALVIVGIVIFNYVQERRYRERAEKAFSSDHADVLFDASQAVRPARLEPSLGALPVADGDVVLDHVDSPDALAPQSAVTGIHTDIDCIGLVLADAPIAAAMLTPFITRAKRLSKPVLWEGLVGGLWQPIPENQPYGAEAGDLRELRVALQLADRRGPATREEIQYFLDLVNEVAAAVSAVSQRVALDEALARAQALDALCADTDIEIAINIVGRNGATFAPTKVRGLAEAAGMTPLPSEEYVLCDAGDAVLFTLRNMDPAQPPGIGRGANYMTGLTFALDVPLVANGAAMLDRMVALAGKVAVALIGEVVDDNRKPLTASGLAIIKKTLTEIGAAMESRGIVPGSPAAMRLFS